MERTKAFLVVCVGLLVGGCASYDPAVSDERTWKGENAEPTQSSAAACQIQVSGAAWQACGPNCIEYNFGAIPAHTKFQVPSLDIYNPCDFPITFVMAETPISGTGAALGDDLPTEWPEGAPDPTEFSEIDLPARDWARVDPYFVAYRAGEASVTCDIHDLALNADVGPAVIHVHANAY